ncbi:hypothetical protein GCM10009616_10670 [Microlunatus lacustris]
MSGPGEGAVTLQPWPVAAVRRLVAGRPPEAVDAVAWHPDYPLPDTVGALTMLLDAHTAMGTLAQLPRWWTYQVRVAGQVVGDVGFHGPPAVEGPVVVEIGYAVVPALRGRGVAGRAVGQLLDVAWRDGADQVLAGTDDDNAASQAVLRRAGFLRRLSGDWAVRRPQVAA